MKSFLLITILSVTAHADMYFECTKQRESEKINLTSSSAKHVDLDITEDYLLRLNKKKVQFQVVDEENPYNPVLKTERLNLGELEIATYEFDGRKCDSLQMGSLTRTAQIGAEDVIETAEYTCICGED